MKILVISHFFPPQRIGGAEKIALVYATGLQQRGHTIQVLCAGGDWETGPDHFNGYDDECYQNIPVRRVNLNWKKAPDPNRALYQNPLIKKLVSQWLEHWQPDVVHIVSLLTLSASVIEAAKARGIPVVFTLVDFWLVCPKTNLIRADQSLCDGQVPSEECVRCLFAGVRGFSALRNALPGELTTWAAQVITRNPGIARLRGLQGYALNIDERRELLARLLPLVDCAIAPSLFLKEVIGRLGLLPADTRHSHYGHDLSWLERMPTKQPASFKRIGFIGQIIALKGLHLLIPAFLAANGASQAKLFIYGDEKSDPAYAASLHALAGEAGNIHFMGPYAHDQIGEVLSQLDIVVVPSQWHENNPLVIQEAFASKTPVIGSRVGGISEFIRHNENGLLFAHDTVYDLRAQIERALTEPGLIARLAGGIGPVKTIAEELDEIEAIYRQLAPGAV